MKILWLSRHDFTSSQEEDLRRIYGEFELTKVDATVSGDPGELKELTEGYDVVAAVLPLDIAAVALTVIGDKPLIMAKSKRELVKAPDGSESKVVFIHDGWFRYHKIEIESEKL